MSAPLHALRQCQRAATLTALMFVLLLAGCGGSGPSSTATESGSRRGSSESVTGAAVEPQDFADATAPVRLQIPDIGLDAPVVPMGWRVVTVDGERTTVWDVPLDAVGWHYGSPGAGAAGNILLSGRQADGEALFAPLALGAVKPDQDIILTDENGQDFVYRVREVSQPIPISDATEEERARAMAYVGDSDGAQLTLITGWPDFTTTHRIFVVADLVEGPQ